MLTKIELNETASSGAIYEGKLSLLDYSTLGKKQAVYIASSEKYIKSLKSLYKKYS